MRKGTTFIGVLLIFISIGALFTWEKWGKNRFIYEEIPVLSENVSKGTTIEREMVKFVNTDVSEKDCLKKTDIDYLLDREAASFIHKGVPLFKEYFEKEGLTPLKEEGRYILSVPEDWQISMPETLSKGGPGLRLCRGKFVTSALVSFVNSEERAMEIVVTDKQAESLSKIAGRGEKMVILYNR